MRASHGCWAAFWVALWSGVDDDLVETVLRDEGSLLASFDIDSEGLPHVLLADPLTPTGHLAGMDREDTAKGFLPAEELPVMVLHPLGYHLLIRGLEDLIEEVKLGPPSQLRTPRFTEPLVRLSAYLLRAPRAPSGPNHQSRRHR